MAGSRFFLRLPDDLLREVLDHIEADPDKIVSLDRRAYLSQDSFALPPTSSPDRAQDIANFRLVCRKFSELGAGRQFARVTTRFSHGGLERLEKIAEQNHLAKHVRKFSYMVPHFYTEGRNRVRELVPRLDPHFGVLDTSSFVRKAKEQDDIIKSGKDAMALIRAAKAFTSLQHIQILRLQDTDDGILLMYLRQNPELTRLVELKWTPACSHCSKTLGTALLKSRSPCSRVSIPTLTVQTPSIMVRRMPETLMHLARNLKSLEIHFDEGFDLQLKMKELSGLFRELFNAARSMQSIHIGFPSHRPLDLPLEEIFHNVKWEKLSAFGIQAWKLDADDIISLARRHRSRLRGLRLRDVLLNEGSRWQDVLEFLHNEMPHLDWVSLRRIGYTEHFNKQWTGAEMPDDPPGGASDSDDDYEDDRDLFDTDSNHDNESLATSPPLSNNLFDNEDAFSMTNSDEEEDAGRGPRADGMGFPNLALDKLTVARLQNTEDLSSVPASELGDNGEVISNTLRKTWEKWIISRGPLQPMEQ